MAGLLKAVEQRLGGILGKGARLAEPLVPELVEAGGLMGSSLPSARFEASTRLPGLPSSSTGPAPKVVEAATDYAKSRGINVNRQPEYGHADPTRGRLISDAYTNMLDDPTNPAVQKAYKAMANETMAQWRKVKKSGLDVDFIPDGMDPYPEGPKQVLADIKDNNHLWVFPTVSGYGTDTANTIAQQAKINPLLRDTGEVIKGHKLVVNDVFRIVHDYFGHGLEGVGFGARGEENAWRAHSRLYSKQALPAVTSETRGQNSWVNFGPHGEANRANQRGTIYADQKIGTMPEWTMREQGWPERFNRQGQAPELRDEGVGVKGPRRPLSRLNPLLGIPMVAGPSAMMMGGVRGRDN
jgi:hypothetical protein